MSPLQDAYLRKHNKAGPPEGKKERAVEAYLHMLSIEHAHECYEIWVHKLRTASL